MKNFCNNTNVNGRHLLKSRAEKNRTRESEKNRTEIAKVEALFI